MKNHINIIMEWMKDECGESDGQTKWHLEDEMWHRRKKKMHQTVEEGREKEGNKE